MKRTFLKLVAVFFVVAGCAQTSSRAPFRLTPALQVSLQNEVLESINRIRSSENQSALSLSLALEKAAKAHSKDMSKQNRPWHFSSNGQSPLQRVAAQNYQGQFLGEVISESYETRQQTITAWMSDPVTRAIILDRLAQEMGVGIHQDPSGKVWWTVVFGRP